jgi:hypothetical protein
MILLVFDIFGKRSSMSASFATVNHPDIFTGNLKESVPVISADRVVITPVLE